MISPFRRAFRCDGELVVFGVPCSTLPPDRAAEAILDRAARSEDRAWLACPTGAHGLVTAAREAGFLRILASADFVLPDGMPLVFLGRLAGFPAMDRVFGPDFMLEVCRRSATDGPGHFFCGGREGVAGELADRLRALFPGLRVNGIMTPPFHEPGEGDLDAIASAFRASGAGVLWLGVSTPKQERWGAALRDRLTKGVIVTVGAAFDYNTGRVHRAPAPLQRLGLEWLVRLLQDPRRLLSRYARIIPLFLLFTARQLRAGCPGCARPAGGRP
jgi:N-acetylglucosaminyldiphosphoundecaprenol N-acetyl-beta-D-mannosaminyltransferase